MGFSGRGDGEPRRVAHAQHGRRVDCHPYGRHHRHRAAAGPQTVLDLRPRQRRWRRPDPPSDATRDRRPSGRPGDPAAAGIPIPAGDQPGCRRRADSRPPGDELHPVRAWRTGIRGTGKRRDLDGAYPSVRSAWCTPAQGRAGGAGVSHRAWCGRTRAGQAPDRVVPLSRRGGGDAVPRHPAAGLPHGPLRFEPAHQHARLSAAGPRLSGARLSPLRRGRRAAPLPQGHGMLPAAVPARGRRRGGGGRGQGTGPVPRRATLPS